MRWRDVVQERDSGGHPYDWCNTHPLARLGKGHRAIECVAIGEGKACQPVVDGPLGKLLYRSGASHEGIVRVHVEVGKAGSLRARD